MTESDVLNAIIDDAIAEISVNYLRPSQQEKRDGMIAAYNDARLKSIDEIVKLREPAQRMADAIQARNETTNYWYWRCYALQIEWIMNVFGAYLMKTGRASPYPVTGRGVLKACDILGEVV